MHFHNWCCVPALSLAPAACLYRATWGSFPIQHRTGVMRSEADMTVPFLVPPLPSYLSPALSGMPNASPRPLPSAAKGPLYRRGASAPGVALKRHLRKASGGRHRNVGATCLFMLHRLSPSTALGRSVLRRSQMPAVQPLQLPPPVALTPPPPPRAPAPLVLLLPWPPGLGMGHGCTPQTLTLNVCWQG